MFIYNLVMDNNYIKNRIAEVDNTNWPLCLVFVEDGEVVVRDLLGNLLSTKELMEVLDGRGCKT